MPRWGWIAAGMIVVAVGGAALLPLRLLIPASGIVADDVRGSVWRGQIDGARWHGIALGDLTTRARPWPPALEFDGPVLRGRLTPNGVEDLTGAIDDFDGLPLTQIALDGVSIARDHGACSHARGMIAVVATPLPQLGALSGPLRCDDGVLRATLRPESGVEGIDARVDLSLDAAQRYRATLVVADVPLLVRSVLLAAGFEATDTGVAMTRQGRL